MSEATNTTDTGATETEAKETTETEQQQPEATKPTETVDFWKTKAREQEKRAKANAEAAKRLQEIEDSNKSESEKLTTRAETAEQKYTDLQGRYHGLLKSQAITKAATDHRAIDVDVITALIGDQVTVNDEGEVEGVDKAIKALTKAKSHLFNTTPAGSRDAGANGNHQPRSTPAQLFADTFAGRV